MRRFVQNVNYFFVYFDTVCFYSACFFIEVAVTYGLISLTPQ